MSGQRRAPKWARWFLRVTVREDRREDLIGDLNEMHKRRSGTFAWLSTSLEALQIGTQFLLWRLMGGARDFTRAFNWAELRLALRANVRHPVLTLTSVLSLSVGIMLATSGFALFHAVQFSELPMDGGDRFVFVSPVMAPGASLSSLGGAAALITPDRFDFLRRSSTSFEYLGALYGPDLNLSNGQGDIVPVVASYLTASALGRAGLTMTAGRPLGPNDGPTSGESGVMLGERFWTDRFGADPGVIGSQIRLGDEDRTVVGVAAADFQFPNSPDLWLAMDERYLMGSAEDPGAGARIFGILRPDVTLASAQEQLGTLSSQFDVAGAEPPIGISVREMTDMAGDSPIMYVFSGLVAVLVLVLLVIAGNIANLMIARTAARSTELAVRSALGAPRRRLVLQLFGESLLLGSVAAVIGVSASMRFMAYFKALISDMPYWVDFGLQPSIVAFVVAVTLLASAVVGLFPALRATRRDPATALLARGASGGQAFGRFSSAMISLEMALSVALLATALVAARGAMEYANPDIDLPANRVLTATLTVDRDLLSRFGEAPQSQLFAELRERIEQILGVRSAGLGATLPRVFAPTVDVDIEPVLSVAGGAGASGARERVGAEAGPPRPAPVVRVGVGFLESVGGDAVLGRTFHEQDYLEGAPAVAVVNAPFVETFLGGRNAIGRRLRLPRSADLASDEVAPWIEIVGVVPDLGMSLGDPALAGGFYLAMGAQGTDQGGDQRFVSLVALTDGEAVEYAGALRRAIADVDPGLMVRRVQPLEQVSAEEGAFIKMMAFAMTGLGAMALLLSLAGMYAIMSFTVTRRTREIGIRVALGAKPRTIVSGVTGRAGRQLLVGGAVGSALSLALLQMRTAVMFRVPDPSPWIFVAVVAVMGLAGLVAAWMPVRRALRILPQEALRAE